MQKFIGKDIQLIYIDSKKNVTIRNVRVLMVGDQRFMAYCHKSQSVRTFNKSGIIDMEVLPYGKQINGQRLVGVK